MTYIKHLLLFANILLFSNFISTAQTDADINTLRDEILLLRYEDMNDMQYEIGLKSVYLSMLLNTFGLGIEDERNLHFELYGRIPVRSWFSVNVGFGMGQQQNFSTDEVKFEGYNGLFLKTGINKALGKKRCRFLMGINHILARIAVIEHFEYQDYLNLWNPKIQVIEERKIVSAFELELGYEVHLGKSWYIGSSMILNTGFDTSVEDNEVYEIKRMPGISGFLGQEYCRFNMVNFSYKFR